MKTTLEHRWKVAIVRGRVALEERLHRLTAKGWMIHVLLSLGLSYTIVARKAVRVKTKRLKRRIAR